MVYLKIALLLKAILLEVRRPDVTITNPAWTTADAWLAPVILT